MEALQEIIVQLAVLAVTGLVSAALLEVRRYLKTKLTSVQYALLERLADQAVWAIEQQQNRSTATPFVTDKKAAAFDLVAMGLTDKNISLPRDVVNAAIESAVATNFNYNRLTKDDSAEPQA